MDCEGTRSNRPSPAPANLREGENQTSQPQEAEEEKRKRKKELGWGGVGEGMGGGLLCLASLIGFSQESVKTWRRRAYQMFTVHDSLTPLAHKEVSKRGKKRKKEKVPYYLLMADE